MSNINFAGRSNYVKVKDHAGLSKSLQPFKHLSLEGGREGKYCLLSEYDTPFYQSGYNIDEDGEEDYDAEIELDPIVHIMPFLEENEILIVQEVSNDKLRSVYGFAEAYQGTKRLTVTTDDIYAKIESQWGTDTYTTVNN